MKRILLLICIVSSLQMQAADIYVTPDSSLSDAIRKAREIRRLQQSERVTIHLSAGTYHLYEPLRLRPEDSGLTIEGDNAIISGGIHITGWKKRGKLLVADVPDFNGRPIDFRQMWVGAKDRSRENRQSPIRRDGAA